MTHSSTPSSPAFGDDTSSTVNSVTSLGPLAVTLGNALQRANALLVTAESCTGGLIAAAVTDVAGSSAWFERAYVTYSNAAKTGAIGVPAVLIENHGAVSEPVAAAMAAGALLASDAHIAVAVTGIAGPGGGTPDKPVGTVCFGWCLRGAAPETETRRFDGNRSEIRHLTAVHAMEGLIKRLANG